MISRSYPDAVNGFPATSPTFNSVGFEGVKPDSGRGGRKDEYNCCISSPGITLVSLAAPVRWLPVTVKNRPLS